ncbi:MAG: hypothetical protein WC554_16670 [Clostridia bacterium]
MSESYNERYERIDKLAKEAIRRGNEDAVYGHYDSYIERQMKEDALERNNKL